METFQSDTSELYETSGCYNFPKNNLDNIPYPDDIVDDSSNPMAENIELPPPPGAQDYETELYHFNKQCMTPNISPKFSPPSLKKFKEPKDEAHIPKPSNVNNDEEKLSSFIPLNSDQDNQESSQFHKTIESPSITETETKKIKDDNKYSPSKIESDDENQDFALVKPKVLGKEQAKKRLMAFSLSKQSNTAVKKQNKINTPMKVCKEKPPNPNKSSGVQEQFRATISAIEEEKRKMMQNMPNYLLLEMSDLSKNSYPILRNSIPNSEKQKNENGNSNRRNDSVKEKDQSNRSRRRSKEKDSYKKVNRRSRSRSRSKSRSIQRSHTRSKKTGERRSKSRTSRKSPSKIRKRSRDRSRSRSRSRSKKEKNNLKSDKKNENSFWKKESPENWKNFLSNKETSSNSGTSKELSEKAHFLKKDELDRPCSPKSPRNFKPIFSYLNKNHKTMGPLQVKPVDYGKSTGLLFSEKTVKYTKTKPFIIWTENPSFATDFYMPKQMLLENCDEATASIIQSITKNKTEVHPMIENLLGTDNNKSRQWYSQVDYLRCSSPYCNELKDTCLNSFSENCKNFNNQNVEKYDTEAEINKDSKTDSEDKSEKDKYVSLVNDSYMSDEELVSEGPKTQPNLNENCVKVRSKWDSDYEGESIEKLPVGDNGDMDSSDKLVSALITSRDSLDDSNRKLTVPSIRNESNVKVEESLKPLALPSPLIHVQNAQNIDSEAPTKKLVSEYEEFLKMVSFDSNSEQNSQTREVTATTPLLEAKLEKQEEKNERENLGCYIKKLEATDWDQESENEEKTVVEKNIFNKNDGHEKVFFKKEEKSKKKRKKVKKKSFSKKKIEKLKSGKSKSLKLTTKRKKKKYEESSSSGSSSDSQISETDSDLNDCKVDKKKKKKKKILKTKKKLRKNSTSETDSDTDDVKSRKKKSKKKRNIKKKKNASSDSEEEIENALLKQLDFKKQMIIKKLEEIDSISEKSGKKKEKDVSQKKKDKENMEDVELLEKFIESNKKKKDLIKMSKNSIKHKSDFKKDVTDKSANEEKKCETSSESDSGSSEFEIKKKNKKKEKRKVDSSDSNDNKEKVSKNKQKKLMNIKNLKSFEEEDKKTNKLKIKEKKSFSSSDSENDIDLPKENKKIKIKKNKKSGDLMINDDETGQCVWEENLEVDKKNFKEDEKKFDWKSRKMSWGRSNRKHKISKDGDDWEDSSSFEESKSTESSWDNEAPRNCNKPEVPQDFISTNENLFKEESSEVIVMQKEVNEKGALQSSETNQEFASENLKNSLSNFSFNESSFCGFGQELSRDFFLNELNFSNSSNLPGAAINSNSSVIQARPFQSVTINSDIKKPQQSELYSPGYSDSEDTDAAAETVSKSDKNNSSTNASVSKKEDIYDPLNCESEGSVENNEIELSSIPLPKVSEILLPGETRNFSNEGEFVAKEVSFINSTQNDIKKGEGLLNSPTNISLQITKNSFNSNDLATFQNSDSNAKFTQKKQVISVKAQQKLKSKAASVFQDESDDENFEISEKVKAKESNQKQGLEAFGKKLLDNLDNNKTKSIEEDEWKEQEKSKKDKNSDYYGDKNKKMDRKRSCSREKKIIVKSPKNKRSQTPDSRTLIVREKREIKSDSFEIEPLKTSTDFDELEQTVQTIPVLTGLGVSSSEKIWNASHLLGYTCSDYTELSENLINHAESFDIYPSEDSKSRNLDKSCIDRDVESREKSINIGERGRKEKRKSRSRSLSPRKRRRSKSPTRRRSPRNRSPRRSLSPKRRERSPYSPRRRSPKRKSPRRYRTSRSPDRRKKSRSRSPRKKRGSSLKRSHSISPRKHRSPKRRLDSPRKIDSPSKTFSPRRSVSPRKDSHYNHHCSGTFQNRIPVIGVSCDDSLKLNSPRFEAPMGFPRLITDSVINESDMNNSFYNHDFGNEFGITNYATESGTNLITVKSHVGEKTNSPERLSLDQRIELELGVQISSGSQSQNEQYQPCSQFQDPNHFQNTYACDNGNSNDSFYQHQNMQIPPDFNESYFSNHQQPSNYGSFQQYSNSQPVQSSVMQVGNIVEVVPASQHPPTSVAPKPHQIMQVGNVLQVVPSSKVPLSQTAHSPATAGYGLPSNPAPLIKTQKATAVVAPSSITPTPNPEAVMNPLIKAIQMEREKRKKERDKRKAEREARRKARQLRREAKLMSVNEKLKKSVQDEGLMLGQEVEDDELLEASGLPSPPVPVEIITISSKDTLPPAGKGILITAGFMPKPPSEKKEVKFADGVCPGEGTSSSGGEDIGSPLPKPKLPKEKRYKKKKTKVKKKVKVQIIRQIIQDEDDDDEDDLSPPPPPPGSPPPVFFARFPFACDAQFPVYQSQTTTTTLTTVQYQTQPLQ